MKQKTAREIIFVTAITFAMVFLFHQLIRLNANNILNQIGILGIPLIFIYLPYIVIRFSGKPPDYYGFSLNKAKFSVILALKTAFIVLPIFALGYWLYWGLINGRTIGIHSPDVELLAWNLIGISFPEEFFFRGYLQTRLNDLFPRRISLWKANIGWSVIIAAILFALAHLLTSFHPARLAVFFPALLFGWLRERTGSIYGPTLLHWLANSTLFLLEGKL